MSEHFADRLWEAIQSKQVSACVGLDPLVERLPVSFVGGEGQRSSLPSPGDSPPNDSVNDAECADQLRRYCLEVLEIVSPLVPVVKVNIAFFERYGGPGVAAYHEVVSEARRAGVVVIGDIKRADIGHSTTQYALAHFSGGPRELKFAARWADAVTVSPYMGFDGVEPFAKMAVQKGKGVFVLVQTSNESAAAVQGLELADGGTVCEAVGRLVQTWASDPSLMGDSGYSSLGAVVSPRDLASTDRLREAMPSCWFLVPGFGAQGRTAREVAHCFKEDGSGAIVNSSRGVIYAHEKETYRAEFGDDWKSCVRQGCGDFVAQVRSLGR